MKIRTEKYLHEVGVALQRYTEGHQGTPPESLEVLVAANLLDEKYLRSPETSERFVYFREGLLTRYQSEAPVAAARNPKHDNVTVLFPGGNVSFLTVEEAKETVESLAAAGYDASALLRYMRD